MKTRIIHTKVWKDNYFYSLDDKEKLAFLYLTTNENVNMIGIYELNDVEFQTWLKTTPEKLDSIKEKFHNDKKFLFKKGWVYVVNHDKYNSYGKGMQEKAYNREISLVPSDVKEFFDTTIDTSIDTSIDTNYKYKIRNNKEEIRNKKKELDEEDLNKIAETMQVSFKTVLFYYEQLIDYIKTKPKDPYKDHAAAIRTWIRRDLNTGKIKKIVRHKAPEIVKEISEEERQENLKKLDEIRNKFFNKGVKK